MLLQLAGVTEGPERNQPSRVRLKVRAFDTSHWDYGSRYVLQYYGRLRGRSQGDLTNLSSAS